ncbi:BLUF domain-containing protein [Aquimarina sp. SS2-1]|uniref:BLUF domain-containing protein n=1 Tax=Aquimarina besae TaxID=3342247 RepID=UPI00366FDCC4
MKNNTWQTISYVSTANRSLTSLEIKELFDYVKTYNNNNNVTGILMYSDGNFFQILEGEKTIIEELFKRISSDYRHHTIIQIFNHEMAKPTFTKYDAKFNVVYEQCNPSELQMFLEKERLNNPETFKSVSYLTNKFMKLS